jgi:hypothetical protein
MLTYVVASLPLACIVLLIIEQCGVIAILIKAVLCFAGRLLESLLFQLCERMFCALLIVVKTSSLP